MGMIWGGGERVGHGLGDDAFLQFRGRPTHVLCLLRGQKSQGHTMHTLEATPRPLQKGSSCWCEESSMHVLHKLWGTVQAEPEPVKWSGEGRKEEMERVVQSEVHKQCWAN